MPFDNTSTNPDRSPSTRTTILKQAKLLLFDDGWCAGKMVDEQNRRCALGAIQGVSGYSISQRHEAIALLAEFATYRGWDNYNRELARDWSYAETRIAAHNNMLGEAATHVMFDRAIARSMELDAQEKIDAV